MATFQVSGSLPRRIPVNAPKSGEVKAIGITLILAVAGILAYQGANWKLAVVCGFASLLTLGIVFVEGSVLGGIGLLLLFLSRREFVS